MRIKCTKCGLEFDLPGGDWSDSVTCPKCREAIELPKAETVKYSPTDVPQLSPPGGQRKPTTLREEEILEAGAIVGQYEIEGLLGRGGMGTVYRAKHAMLTRTVALKVLPAKFAKDPEFVHRFRREAQALANLSHPNIVAVHDLGVQGDIYFFAMEFVDGVNMRDVLAHKKLSPEDALRVVPQLCEALEYAHSQGIIHRDIKPENILLDRAGRAKIADFGLAKILKGDSAIIPLTQTNVIMGTVEYMAPEQRDSLKQVDHRADIYSLGVVLYEMLTGTLPVGVFDKPSKNLKIDVRIDDVVLKALERDPDRRYQRASQMGTDVTRVTVSPSAAPPIPQGEFRVTNLRTNKTLATSKVRVLAVRTADARTEIVGWGKPDIGVEADGEFLLEGDVVQSSATTRSLRVFVPKGIDVDVIAARADVSVAQTECKATVKAAEGSVTVTNHVGALGVTVQSGAIQVRGLKSQDVEIRTGSGSIELDDFLIDGGRANVETEMGHVRVALAAASSAKYTLQTVSGSIVCPVESGTRDMVNGSCGAGAANVYVRASRGDIDFAVAGAQTISMESVKHWWHRLTPKQQKKIGVYLIVNAAFFVFFGLVSHSLSAPICIAVFWGMGLALDLWGDLFKKKKRQETAPAPVAAPSPAPVWTSTLAILGFLAAVAAVLTGVGLSIVYGIERSWDTLDMSWNDLQELRIGVVSTAFAAGILSIVAFFTCVAASSHVARSKGGLKGRGWASGGILMSLAPVALIVFSIVPRYRHLHRETLALREESKTFARELCAGRGDAEIIEAMRPHQSVLRLADPESVNVVVGPDLGRARIELGGGDPLVFDAVKKDGVWKIRPLARGNSNAR